MTDYYKVDPNTPGEKVIKEIWEVPFDNRDFFLALHNDSDPKHPIYSDSAFVQFFPNGHVLVVFKSGKEKYVGTKTNADTFLSFFKHRQKGTIEQFLRSFVRSRVTIETKYLFDIIDNLGFSEEIKANIINGRSRDYPYFVK